MFKLCQLSSHSSKRSLKGTISHRITFKAFLILPFLFRRRLYCVVSIHKLFMRLRIFIFFIIKEEGERFMWRDFLIAWYPDVRLTPLSDPLPLITQTHLPDWTFSLTVSDSLHHLPHPCKCIHSFNHHHVNIELYVSLYCIYQQETTPDIYYLLHA